MRGQKQHLQVVLVVVFLIIVSISSLFVPSCFRFRSRYNVSHTTSSVTTTDVQLSLDTASLISQGKAFSCSEFRFRDAASGDWLDFWWESTCGTNSTRVWVTPTLEVSTNSTIEAYYGSLCSLEDIPLSYGAEISWSGKFMSSSDCSGCCGSSWDDVTMNYAGRFIRPRIGDVGTVFNATLHTHASDSVAPATPMYSSDDANGAHFEVPDRYHTHTMDDLTQEMNGADLPPYRELYLCESSHLDMVSGLVVPMTGPWNSFSSDWSRYTALDDRFVRIGSSGTEGGFLSHIHELSGKTNPPEYEWNRHILTAASRPSMLHRHNIPPTNTTPASNLPEYVQVIFAKVMVEASSHPIDPSVAWFIRGSLPPKGFKTVMEWNSTFLRGSALADSTVTPSEVGNHSALIGALSGFDEAVARGGGESVYWISTVDHIHPPFLWISSSFPDQFQLMPRLEIQAVTYTNFSYESIEFIDEIEFLCTDSSGIVCENLGNCSSSNYSCECPVGSWGEYCQHFYCGGELRHGPNVCGGYVNWTCIEPDRCVCSEGYTGSNCDVIHCYDKTPEDPALNGTCSYPNGTCISPNNCSCEVGFTGPECEFAVCYGKSTEFPELACSYPNGTCIGPNECLCADGYYGSRCELLLCFGVDSTDSQVCTGNGSCVAPDFCICTQGYYHDNCSGFNCSIASNVTDGLCSNHGICLSTQFCSCEDGYTGTDCSTFECYGLVSTSEYACSSHGDCVGHDECECNPSESYGGHDCQYPICGVEWRPYEACSGSHGNCTSPGECLCRKTKEGAPMYFGTLCESFSCFGTPSTDAGVCSGNGVCMDHNLCDCHNDSNYVGEQCLSPTSTALGSTDVGVSLEVILGSVFGVVGGLVLFLLLATVILFYFLRKKIAKAELNRVEVVELRFTDADGTPLEDSEVVELQIRPALFTIPYESLELSGKVLGAGGSGSRVLKAGYGGTDVALKMFRLNLETSQEDMDEFMKEIDLMLQLQYPFVIRYYGATLHLPMLGMVMELCQFSLKKYIRQGGVPFKTKLRLLMETALGMNYLHSMSIVHRDLKLENVLLDQNLSAKIMDFGLSKAIRSSMSQQKTAGIGTSIYMAPEIVRGDAIMAFIVLSENFSPYGKDVEFVEYKTSAHEDCRPDLSQIRGVAWLKTLISSCWSHDPLTRPTFSYIARQLQNYLETVSTVVYIRGEDEDDDDAEDFGLRELTVDCLLEQIEGKFVGREIQSVAVLLENGKQRTILRDRQVEALEQDSMLVVALEGGDESGDDQ